MRGRYFEGDREKKWLCKIYKGYPLNGGIPKAGIESGHPREQVSKPVLFVKGYSATELWIILLFPSRYQAI